MCIQRPVPRREIKEHLPPATGPKWVEGWKVLRVQKRVQKEGKIKRLLSAMADDEWKPGIMFARAPANAKFTGGKLPDGDYGFHILCVKPPRPRAGETVLRVEYDADSVSGVGEDSAGGVRCKTVVAKIVRVSQKDYKAALKGGPRLCKKKVAKVQKRVSSNVAIPHLNFYDKVIKKFGKWNQSNFVALLSLDKDFMDVSKSILNSYYTRANSMLKVRAMALLEKSKNSADFCKKAKAKLGIGRNAARAIYRDFS